MNSKINLIIGCPRSGTSLTYWLLASHPELSYPDTGTKNILSHRYLRVLDRLGVPLLSSSLIHNYCLPDPGGIDYEPAFEFLGYEPEFPQEGDDILWYDLLNRTGIDKDDFTLKELQENPWVANQIQRRYQHLSNRTGKSKIIDKAPRYTVWLDVIKDIFPDTRIIHVIRDGRAVVNSHAYRFKFKNPDRKFWGPKPDNWKELENENPVKRASHQWNQLVSEGKRGRELFGDNYLEVKYEDLTEQTVEATHEIFEFLDVDPSVSQNFDDRGIENRNYKWKENYNEEFDDQIWTQRSAIEADEYDYFEIMRPLLESLGYVSDHDALFPGKKSEL